MVNNDELCRVRFASSLKQAQNFGGAAWETLKGVLSIDGRRCEAIRSAKRETSAQIKDKIMHWVTAGPVMHRAHEMLHSDVDFVAETASRRHSQWCSQVFILGL